MIHEIGPDGVVPIHGKSDFQFRADTIDACHQNWRTDTAKIRSKQSSEPADRAKHLRAMRGANEPVNAALESISEINIDAGSGVSFSFCHALVGAVYRTARGHLVSYHLERSRDISDFQQIARDSSTSLGMTGLLRLDLECGTTH